MPIARSVANFVLTSVAAAVFAYSTSFNYTENPISNGGKWTNGGTTGTSWQNVQTNGTLAFGVAVSGGYDDCIACLSGASPTSHYAQATVHRVGGYVPGTSHEVELLTGWTITAGVAKGYEATWGIGLPVVFARWNGGLGNFTLCGGSDDNLSTGKAWGDSSTGTGGSALVEGDVVKVVYAVSGGNVLLIAYVNGVEVLRCADTSTNRIVSGQPGMGFFARTGATMTSYCFSAYSAG